jgi:adenylate cyclase
MYGELIPLGGGDPIPLMKKSLLVGRRESCDIVLRFPNISSHHCQLNLDSGYWYVKDLNSRNGLKVDEVRVTEKRLDPGCTLTIAKHKYEVSYSPHDLGAVGPPPRDDDAASVDAIFGKSLLERAGLSKNTDDHHDHDDEPKEYRPDVMDSFRNADLKRPKRP